MFTDAQIGLPEQEDRLDERQGGSGWIVIVYDNDKNTRPEVIGILQQATSFETPDARIYGFFGLLVVVLILVEGAAQLANAQIQIAAIVWNRLSGVVVGVLTALLLSVLLLYEIQAAGNPSGGGTPDDLQAQVHDTVKASRLAVPLMNAIYKPIVAIFQPVLPTDPHQYFSRGPVS